MLCAALQLAATTGDWTAGYSRMTANLQTDDEFHIFGPQYASFETSDITNPVQTLLWTARHRKCLNDWGRAFCFRGEGCKQTATYCYLFPAFGGPHKTKRSPKGDQFAGSMGVATDPDGGQIRWETAGRAPMSDRMPVRIQLEN
jgi:hypothetical protein